MNGTDFPLRAIDLERLGISLRIVNTDNEGTRARALANANLLNAAQALLTALSNILMHIGAGREDGVEWVCEPIHVDEIRAAREAVAKATGKQA